MRTVEEEYRIECLEHLLDSITHWDVHRSDDVSMSKEKRPSSYSRIYQAIIDNFYRKEDIYYFLNLQTVKFHLDPVCVLLTASFEIIWVKIGSIFQIIFNSLQLVFE